MLRRKLLARLGLLVAGFVAGAVVAIVLLQGVLKDLDRIRDESGAAVDEIQHLGDATVEIEVALNWHEGPGEERLATIEQASKNARDAYEGLAAYGLADADNPAATCYERIGELLPRFLPDPATLRGTLPSAWTHRDPGVPGELAAEIAHLRQIARAAFAEREVALSKRLRTLIVALAVAALVMVNITVIVLLHTSTMILRPVDALVQGSRELAKERFDHRVEVDGDDEFGELAHAYNRLAEQLQSNEARKTETLKQLGVTLNHELNNVISIIEMQLAILDRRAGGDQELGDRLRKIRTNLGRIASTVASLKDVRRVVVTDYSPGTQMVDLVRSVAPDDPEPARDGDHEETEAGQA